MTYLKHYHEDLFVEEPSNVQLTLFGPNWEGGYIRPPYGWRLLTVKWGGDCWYCAGPVKTYTRALYSHRYKMLAHIECNGNLGA